jgi:hypothetical protein
MYNVTVPVMIKALTNLSGVIDKGVLHATSKKFNPDALLTEKLIADQFAFVRQVQVACDTAKATAAHLAGVEAPKHEDIEKTMDELKARIDKTVEYLKTFKAEDIDGTEDKQIPFKYAPGKSLSGFNQVLEYALPNFFFHVVTAYAILRHAGVEIGKMDYLGSLSLEDMAA